MTKEISIIIPTYNSEKYIRNLLDKLVENDNVEIIVINDGSTDNTDKILKKYKNIKYISYKNNKGVSHARNMGLQEVTTKYFTFIDSDDQIDDNMLEIMLDECKSNNLDLCICNYIEKNDKKTIKSKYKYNDVIYNNEKLIEDTLFDKVSTVVWAKLYKTETYKNIRFNEKLKMNEDYEYVIRCFKNTTKAKLINQYLYKYIKNNNSITNNLTCSFVSNNNYLDFIKDLNLNNYNSYSYFININNLRLIHLFMKCIDKSNKYKSLKNQIDKKRLKSLLKTNISIFNKVEIIIFLISIKLYIIIYPLFIKVKNIIRS